MSDSGSEFESEEERLSQEDEREGEEQGGSER